MAISRLIAPEERGQRAFGLTISDGPLGVVDHGFDLAAVAHDTRVPQQALHIGLAELRHAMKIETRKGRAKVLAFVENGQPAQAGPKAFQTPEFSNRR